MHVLPFKVTNNNNDEYRHTQKSCPYFKTYQTYKVSNIDKRLTLLLST